MFNERLKVLPTPLALAIPIRKELIMPTDNIRNISLKLRLYPTQEQKTYFNKCFGSTRFVYNYYLAERSQFYNDKIKGIEDKNKRNEIYKTFQETPLKDLKLQYPWLKEVDSQGICNAYMNLRNAYQNFYSGKSKLPRFHSRRFINSYKDSQMKQNCLNWSNHTIEIPKIKNVRFRNSRAPNWYKNRTKICSIIISKTPQEKYYVSILFEVKVKSQEKHFDNENQAIGLDFDCDDMYIDSNGQSALKDFGFKKQKQLHHKQLHHLQIQLARKHKGSKNYEKARIKLTRMEEHIANCRRDWIEKETKRLTDNYQLIGVENLSIQSMMKGSRNAKNYVDISWSKFINRLEQKSIDKNCQVIKINKFFASSQTCSCCGYKNKDVATKHLEVWKCPECGQIHQRDYNAAINIKNEAIRVLREPEESSEKSNRMSKDQNSLSSISELANLALECSRLGNAGNNL